MYSYFNTDTTDLKIVKKLVNINRICYYYI